MQYQLIYFNARALTEVTRLLFAYGDVPFEDVRIEEAEWPLIKSEMPFGKLPILKLNGKIIGHQSVAIARFAANKVGLQGKDEFENLEIDAVVDSINDFRGHIAAYYYEKDDYVKSKVRDPLFKEIIPFYLERLEAVVKSNNGYFALGRLTWADFYWMGLLDYFNAMVGRDIILYYPNLKSVAQKIESIPSVKKWIDSRPETLL